MPPTGEKMGVAVRRSDGERPGGLGGAAGPYLIFTASTMGVGGEPWG